MLGTALEFNGIDAYVQLVANSELLLGANPNEWSYSFWFKKGPNSTKRVFISNYDSDNSDSLIGIWAGVNASSGSGRVFINVRGYVDGIHLLIVQLELLIILIMLQ